MHKGGLKRSKDYLDTLMEYNQMMFIFQDRSLLLSTQFFGQCFSAWILLVKKVVNGIYGIIIRTFKPILFSVNIRKFLQINTI